MQLQKEMASTGTVPITPLKTPPHLFATEELANLSPAKPFQLMGVTQRDLTQASFSSQGFHPLYMQHLTHSSHSDASNSESADSSSDSESDMRGPTLASAGHFHRVSQGTGGENERQSNAGGQYPMTLPAQHSVPTQFTPGPESLAIVQSRRKKRQTNQQEFSAATAKKYKMNTNISSNKHSPLPDPNLSIREQDKDEYSPVPSDRRPQQTMGNRGGPLQNKGVSGRLEDQGASGRGNFMQGALAASSESSTPSSSLLVSIPLVDLRVPDSTQQQLSKPKATVEPYNVRTPAPNKTPRRRNTADTLPEAEEVQGRDRYSRLQTDEYTTVHDYHGNRERSRVQWEREHRNYGSSSRPSGRGGGGGEYGRGHGWDRGEYYRGNGEEYWSDAAGQYESSRAESQRGGSRNYLRVGRKKDPDYFMQEAKRRKKDADKIMVSS